MLEERLYTQTGERYQHSPIHFTTPYEGAMQEQIIEPAREVEYRPIEGYPGYRVGIDGGVWSCWEMRYEKGFGRGGKCVCGERWRRLKPYAQKKTGYLSVQLYSNGKSKNYLVHRLVLETFIGPCPAGMEGCHGPDHNPANCNLDNLRWDTKKNNQADRLLNGTHLRGQNNRLAKLTDAQARIVRELAGTGLDCVVIGRMFNVSRYVVNRVVLGKTYRPIEGQ